MRNSLKTHLLRSCYWLAYYLAAPAIYSRQPFVKYPNIPTCIFPRSSLSLPSSSYPSMSLAPVVEVGCNQGWTTLKEPDYFLFADHPDFDAEM